MAEEMNRRRSEGRRSSEPERPRKKRRRRKGTVRTVIVTLLLIAIVTSALLACFAAVYIKSVIMPEASLDLSWFNPDLSSTMYYLDSATGEYQELRTLHGAEDRVWVRFEDIPEDLRDAAVAIEDKRFYKHGGVDWLRTLKSVFTMFTGGKQQGGSTITQQLIKNLTEYDEVTVKRKVTEIFRALEFDKNHSKDTTLEWYLNYIYLGSGCRGVYTASLKYFGKEVSELSLAECASLIGITNNPTLYSPYSEVVTTNPDTGEKKTGVERNKSRQELILKTMLEEGYIEQEEYDAAVAQELVFHDSNGSGGQAETYTWYEEAVIQDVREDLIEQLHISRDLATQMIFHGGLSIYTCLDPNVQAKVDAVYQDTSNLPYKSAGGQQMQSAITVIDNETGNVVALSGGMGEKKESLSWNRATTTTRQPGSSIKPLAVYAPGIEMGLITTGTAVDDYPYQILGGSAWPVNSYSGYRGLISVYEAVQDSSNTTAVRVLGDYVTPEKSYDFMLNKFHFTTLVPDDIGLAQLALGGLTDGVTTLEMAAAYSAFPNGGVYHAPRTYTKVTQTVDGQEKVLLENNPESEVVMKDTTAYCINYMLQGVVSGGTGTGANFSGMTIAGKTGTTNRNFDRWFVGYTPYYTAAVWTGYDRNEKMRTSGNPAAALWRNVMSQVHSGLQNKRFPSANGIVSITYCKDSGMLATEACQADPRGSRVSSGYVVRENAPTEYCTLHTTVELCTADPVLDDAGNVVSYHLAGEYCPADTRTSAVRVDYTREPVGGAVAKDQSALKSSLEETGYCRVHDEHYLPPEPTDPIPTETGTPTLPPTEPVTDPPQPTDVLPEPTDGPEPPPPDQP
ncbi:MAG: transglycosylase [Oscillospiraceae bacterium]|nr:transglycosylase [Oscillospiraceae bacterium]